MPSDFLFASFFSAFDLNRTALFYVFCGLALLFIFVRSIFQKDWNILWESFRSASSARLHHQQGNLRFGVPMLILFLIASTIFTICIWEYAALSDWALVTENFDFITLLAAIFSFLVLRLGFYVLATYLIPNHKEAMLYVKTIALFGIYTAFALVPFALLVAFNDAISVKLLFAGFLLIVAFFVGTRLYRGISIAGPYFSKRKDYFFLYFCALEIVPFALALKAFWPLFF